MSDDLDLIRYLAFAAALVFALSVERIRPHLGQPASLRVNLSLWITGAAAIGLLCGSCGFAVASYATAHDFGLARAVGISGWLNLVLAVVALDLVSYGWHRANHTATLLWRFHQVHHSDDSFTVTTGLRFHPGELLLALPVRLTAIALLGISPVAVLIFEAIFATANLFEHGDIELPVTLERRLGRLLVIPALHRRHHARDVVDLNGNFGTIFSVWDRAFGTLRASSSTDRFAIGLPGVARPVSVGHALLLPATILPGRR